MSEERVPPRWRLIATRALLVGGVLATAVAPWWGPPFLSQFDFFHVRRIEFEGVRYADAGELTARLAIDTLASVWMPLEPLGDRVATHPMITTANVRRSLPGTLRISVEERIPVALVAGDHGLVAVDVRGEELPIDPSRTPLDVPIANASDSALLRVLDDVRTGAPLLWTRLSEARLEGANDVRLVLGTVQLRTRLDVTVARLGDIFPVEADLAQRRLRPTELDLRFRDQVIARLP